MTTRVIDEWIWEIQKRYHQKTLTWPVIVQGTLPGRDVSVMRNSPQREIWFWYPESDFTEAYWDLVGLAMDQTWASYMVSTSDIISSGLGLPGYSCVPSVWVFRIEKRQKSQQTTTF